jgi:hypothetical protein
MPPGFMPRSRTLFKKNKAENGFSAGSAIALRKNALPRQGMFNNRIQAIKLWAPTEHVAGAVGGGHDLGRVPRAS